MRCDDFRPAQMSAAFSTLSRHRYHATHAICEAIELCNVTGTSEAIMFDWFKLKPKAAGIEVRVRDG
jgi:hypothetical protein